MLDSRIWAEPFKNTVEGRPFPMSAKIENDRVILCIGQPVEKGADLKPQLIAKLLTSNIPLSEDVRSMIADWLDLNGDSALCFKQFKRRKPGRYPAWTEANVDIGLFVEERIQSGQKFESAVVGASEVFGKSRTTVTNAYSSVKKARQLSF